MTPSQLRVRASKNIESAGGLLEMGDTDNACNLAGHAVELALKARYCTRHGIADFPDTLAMIKAASLQEVAHHDLQKLLKLAKGIEIPKYSGIDWERVCEWDVAQRYDPVGTVTKDHAEARVQESGAVVDLLGLHELLERLSHVRAALEKELNSQFDFFAADITTSSGNLAIVVGGPAIWRMGQDDFLKRLKQSVDAHTDADLVASIHGYKLINKWSSLFRAYVTAQQGYGGFMFVTNHYAYGVMIGAAYFVPPAGFNVGDFNSPSLMHGNMYL